MNENCAACKEMPLLTEILRHGDRAQKMARARLLLLCMQRFYSSLRYNPACHSEKAGDVIEATGGILSPYRTSARGVVRHLSREYGLCEDDIKETLEDMGALARQCKIFHAYMVWSAEGEQETMTRAYATIRKEVTPVIQPCRGGVCPVCESRELLAMPAATPNLTSPPGSASALPSPPGLLPPTLATKSSAAAASH